MAQKIEYSANFKRNYVAFFAFFLFAAMIFSEFFLAVSIPIFVQRENAYAEEIRKRELLMTFDHARQTCREIKESSEIIALEKKLLSDTLDHLAIYLRKESGKLTVEDVNNLYPHVKKLDRVALRLKAGKTFSQESKLNSGRYINSLLNKRKIQTDIPDNNQTETDK